MYVEDFEYEFEGWPNVGDNFGTGDGFGFWFGGGGGYGYGDGNGYDKNIEDFNPFRYRV